MDRRKFFLIALVGLGAPRAALGQGARLARIAVITFGFAPESPPLKAFLRELRELGYVEGKTLLLEYRFAQGQASRLASLASEVLRMNVECNRHRRDADRGCCQARDADRSRRYGRG
jgi:putative ABC transport system substrate-binding protein